MKDEPMIEVPQSWLEQIANLAERVSDQLNQLPLEDYSALMKTDISALTGYTSSARTIIKLKGVARRNTF